MGYRFREDYDCKYTIGIVQKPLCEKLGVNRAVIIPNHWFKRDNYGEIKYREFHKLLSHYPHFVVKHCDNPYELTHITSSGIVNVFGKLLTDVEPQIEIPQVGIDIEKGQVKSVGCDDVEQIERYLM